MIKPAVKAEVNFAPSLHEIKLEAKSVEKTKWRSTTPTEKVPHQDPATLGSMFSIVGLSRAEQKTCFCLFVLGGDVQIRIPTPPTIWAWSAHGLKCVQCWI